MTLGVVRIICGTALLCLVVFSWFLVALVVRESNYLIHVTKIATPQESEFVAVCWPYVEQLNQQNHCRPIPEQALPTIRQRLERMLPFTQKNKNPDRFRLVVERTDAPGSAPVWGAILAAEYWLGSKRYSAVRFVKKDGTVAYYNADGIPIGSFSFVSPLQHAILSSAFQPTRFHPMLRLFRPHFGIDLAAPSGTPVLAAADGIVEETTRKKESGRLVVLKHAEDYETRYLHLLRFASQISPGVRVRRGQVIGFVGMTGLATRPHLHFELRRRGVPLDPKKYELKLSGNMNLAEKKRFFAESKKLFSLLPNWANSAL